MTTLVIRRDARKDPILFPPIQEVEWLNSHRRVPTLPRDLVEQYQPLEILIRKRAQQNAVDEAEDRAGRADSQRQRNDRGQSEARLLQQHSQTVARVLPKCFHSDFPLGNAQYRLLTRAVLREPV